MPCSDESFNQLHLDGDHFHGSCHMGKIMDTSYLDQIRNLNPLISISTLLVLLLGILYFSLKNKNTPPGPWGVPIFGYWPYFKTEAIHLPLQELVKKYGDVYSINVAGQLFIHLGSIKALKEAHVTKGDYFERFSEYGLFAVMFKDGVTASNGEKWKLQRKFFIQTFKEYGMSSVKGYLAGPIYDSVNATVDMLKETNEKPVNIISILNVRSSGILRRMMFNEDEISCEEVEGILGAYGKLVEFMTSKNTILIGNIAKYFIFPRLPGFRESLEYHKTIVQHLRNIIRRHEETFNKNNIRDMIDAYIKERRERRSKSDPTAEYFSDDGLVSSMIQFIGDGILGITIFIAYFIHELLENPEEQEKIYEELIEVVGTDRQVTLEDKSRLPYTNAFIQEVLRTTDFFTVFPSLKCVKETTLSGYRIPKGAITIVNLWAMHRDPNVFEDPDTFKPSRYISEPGKPRAELPVTFGVGRRSCAGESFAMMQVFLFLTIIVKNFRLSRPKGNVKKSFLDGVMEVCAHPRK